MILCSTWELRPRAATSVRPRFSALCQVSATSRSGAGGPNRARKNTKAYQVTPYDFSKGSRATQQ